MAITLEELEIKFTAQYGGLQQQLNDIQGKFRKTENAVASTSRAMAGFGRMAKTFLTVYVGRALWRVGKESLAMANEVVESENLFEESMKGMSAQARKWSDNLRDTLGLNAFSLRKNIGTMNVMLRSMGIGADKAYEMSESLTLLAEDMASFYNLDPGEMFGKLQSGMTGMGMPLKQLGILVDEHIIKQYAVAEGISKTGKELTHQEKVLARYAAIMAQTSAAQGDLARTIDSPANQLRVLSNTLDQARVALGQAFQPIQSAVMPLLSSLASAAMTAAQAINYFIRSLTGFGTISVFASLVAGKSADAQKDLTKSLNGTAKSLKKAGGAAKQAAKDTKVGLKAFDEINKLTEEATKTGGGGGGGGGGLDEIEPPSLDPMNDYANSLEMISEKIKAIAAAIREFWEGLKSSVLGSVIGAGWETLKSIFNDIILPIGEWFIQNPRVIGDAIGAIAIAFGTFKIATGLSRFLSDMASAIRDIGKAGTDYKGIPGFINRLGSAIKAHPGIATAAIIAGGISIIANAISENEKKLQREDLAKRFGDVAISMQDLKTIASQTKTPFVEAIGKLKQEYTAIEEAASKIEQLASQSSTILFTYALSPEPMDDDKKAQVQESVQAVIDQTMEALNAAKAFSVKSIKMTFDDTQAGNKLIEIDEANWAIIEGEIKSISEDLDAAVAAYLLSDSPTPEQAAAVARYQNKLADLVREATNIDKAMAEVRLNKILIGFEAEPTISAETVKNFDKALKEELETQIGSIDVYIDSEMALHINRARVAGDIAGKSQAEIDAEAQKIKDYWEEQRNVQLEAAKLSIGQVYFTGVANQVFAAYSKEIKQGKAAIKVLNTDFIHEAAKQLFGSEWEAALGDPSYRTAISQKASMMFTQALKDINIDNSANQQAARKNIKAMLEMMKPTITEYKKLYEDYKKSGKEIPLKIAEGLRNYQALEAIVAAGEELERSLREPLVPNPEDYRKLGEDAVDYVEEGASSRKATLDRAMNNIGRDAMNNLWKALESGKITKEQYDQIILAEANGTLTELAAKFEASGNESVAAICRSLRGGESDVRSATAQLANTMETTIRGANLVANVKFVVQGLVKNIKSNPVVQKVSNAVSTIANNITTTFKNLLGIKSPSTVFAEFGKNIDMGLAKGILANIKHVIPAVDSLSSATFDAMGSINTDMLAPLNIGTGGRITVEGGGSIADAISDGISQGVSQVMENLELSWNVDGVQYGNMTIQHMNTAQRMAGRVLLEM